MKKRAVITILIILTLAFELKVYPPNAFGSEQFDTFSNYTLSRYMSYVGIEYPEVVMAQARLESGHFTSTLFKENNNLFGMKLPRKRQTEAIGEKNGYALYKDWKASVRDYKLWQDGMIHKTKGKDSYISYIGTKYAKDKKYEHHIRKLIKKNEKKLWNSQN